MRTTDGAVGFPVFRRDLGFFGRVLRCLFVRRPPQACAKGFILPRAFRLLQSTTACDLPAVSRYSLATKLDRRAPPVGSSPSSRHRPAASTTPQGIPTSGSSSLLAVSHDLEGLLRLQPLRVYFTPLPRPGFALQGFVPLRGAVPGFPGRFMPSCRLNASACGLTRASLCAPAFRALLPAVSAVPTEAV